MPRKVTEYKAPVDRGIMVGYWCERDKHEAFTKTLESAKVKDAEGKAIKKLAKLGEYLVEQWMKKHGA